MSQDLSCPQRKVRHRNKDSKKSLDTLSQKHMDKVVRGLKRERSQLHPGYSWSAEMEETHHRDLRYVYKSLLGREGQGESGQWKETCRLSGT